MNKAENYRKYIEEPRKLIEGRNAGLELAMKGLIAWKEFFRIEEYVRKKLEEEYGYKL